MVLVWLVARSRARVVVLVLAGGLLVYEYIKACFVWWWCVGVYMYLCIYVYNTLVACVVVVCSCVYG